MNFVSFSFFIFFLAAFTVRLTIGRKRTERPFLLLMVAASCVFYAWHIPEYIWILILSTVIDYLAARYIAGTEDPLRRKIGLIFSLSTNLGLLGFFKYCNFFMKSLQQVLPILKVDIALPQPVGLLLPMGISFYTFQSMSYTIDVYRRELKAESSFARFFLYVSFFPQLVAGPIVRAKDFLYQISRERHIHSRVMLEGCYLIIRGFFLKMVIADNLAFMLSEAGGWYWDAGYGADATATGNLLRVLMFSGQIFGDFAGYSDIARGLCYLFGFTIPINFNAPYIAGTFSDFWRRWHISLSTWLRDYLYIPLGGNKKSKLRTYVNLMLVMLLGGLWHGAAWNFVIWGGIHGFGLVIERFLGLNVLLNRNWKEASPMRMFWFIPLRIVWFSIVQATVLLAWVFFRCDTYEHAKAFMRAIVNTPFTSIDMGEYFGFLSLPRDSQLALVSILMLFISATHLRNFLNQKIRWLTPGHRENAFWSACMLYALITGYGRVADFIYFAF